MGVSFRQESAESIGAPPYGMRITIGSDHRCRVSTVAENLPRKERYSNEKTIQGIICRAASHCQSGICLTAVVCFGTATRSGGRLSFGYAINLVSDKPMQNFAADMPTLRKGVLVNEIRQVQSQGGSSECQSWRLVAGPARPAHDLVAVRVNYGSLGWKAI